MNARVYSFFTRTNKDCSSGRFSYVLFLFTLASCILHWSLESSILMFDFELSGFALNLSAVKFFWVKALSHVGLVGSALFCPLHKCVDVADVDYLDFPSIPKDKFSWTPAIFLFLLGTGREVFWCTLHGNARVLSLPISRGFFVCLSLDGSELVSFNFPSIRMYCCRMNSDGRRRLPF